MMPLWLEQKRIAAWLAKEIKPEKLKRKAASKPDNAEVTTAKKQKTTQKGKRKANALTKGGKPQRSKKPLNQRTMVKRKTWKTRRKGAAWTMTEAMPGMSQMTASPPWTGFRCIFRPLVVFGLI